MQTFDIESGCDTELLNLNPEGWIAGVSNERNWGMLYGMDVGWHRNMILAGDSLGFVHAVDPRASQPLLGKHQLHKKGNKASASMLVLKFTLLMCKAYSRWHRAISVLAANCDGSVTDCFIRLQSVGLQMSAKKQGVLRVYRSTVFM